jgi:hypothetical protein
VSNIDRGLMMIRIEGGKGGSNGWRADKPITAKVIWEAVQQAAGKRVSRSM